MVGRIAYCKYDTGKILDLNATPIVIISRPPLDNHYNLRRTNSTPPTMAEKAPRQLAFPS